MQIEQPTIIGAGFAGLLAAHAWPAAQIIEAAPGPKQMHNALLRFRSDAVARLTGVEFRRVTVRKGIWFEGGFVPPNPRVGNLYARKVLGRVAERSIWNLEAADRFIAPEDFYDQLISAVGDRVKWGEKFNTLERPNASPVISTAPLPVMLAQCPVTPELQSKVKCARTPIRVRRWRVPGADVFQTVYFPDVDTSVYRASITGELLIVEEIISPTDCVPADLGHVSKALNYSVEEAFGLDEGVDCQFLDCVEQSYGKVEELSAAVRKQVLFELTTRHGIYSLGRFATWRNILLDDVVDDIAVIKRLLKTGSAYDARKVAS